LEKIYFYNNNPTLKLRLTQKTLFDNIILFMILNILQIIFAVLLILAILLQQKGSGLGAAFGSGGSLYKAKKRGSEKVLFIGTIVLAIAFFSLLAADIFI